MEVNNMQQGVQPTPVNIGGTNIAGASSTQETALTKDATPAPSENLKEIEQEASKEAQAQKLRDSVDEMNSKLSPLNFGVKFGYNDDINAMYVSVYERDTDKVIRKIPSEEAIQLMAKMKEVIGIIFDQKG